MPKTLSWDSSYSVGDVTLDNQHKVLMSLCNQLATCAGYSGEPADAIFLGILDELSTYAKEHFATEEAILQACDYPRIDTQKWDHSEYEKHVSETLADAKGGVLDKSGLQKLLSNWWNDHILISDMDYKRHVVAFNQQKEAKSDKSPKPIPFTGKEVIELRKKAGLNQGQFWSKLGVTQSGGSRYESGRGIPEPVQLLLQLACGKDKQAAELLEWLRGK